MKYKTLENSYLSAFCMEVAMLLQAGIAPGDGVMMLHDDEPSEDGKTVMRSLINILDDGEPLSVALSKSGYFPRYMSDMVEIGEKTGRLTHSLKALSEHYDRQGRLSAAIKSAIIYPSVLLVMMVAVILILIIKVLPIFNAVFNRLGSQMSPLSISLMHFGGWLRDASVVIAAVFGVVIISAITAWLSPAVRGTIVRVLKDKFGNRGIFGRIASSRFTSAMAFALASGLDTEEAVQMAAAVSGGGRAAGYNSCINLLRNGSTLSEAMHRAGILSARNSRMLSIGSRSGMADVAMAEIARRSDVCVQEEIDGIVGRIEPALVIIASAMVAVILLSVMLPLVSIMTTIG